MKQMTKVQLLTPVLLSLAFPVVALEASGCKKDEPPPPLPSAAPAAVTPPPAASPIELVPEVPVASASASASAAPVKTGGGSGGGSLKACCNALRQNAASAPEPNKGFMLTAAQICDGAAAAGQTSAMGPITAALRGAGLPTACK